METFEIVVQREVTYPQEIRFNVKAENRGEAVKKLMENVEEPNWSFKVEHDDIEHLSTEDKDYKGEISYKFEYIYPEDYYDSYGDYLYPPSDRDDWDAWYDEMIQEMKEFEEEYDPDE